MIKDVKTADSRIIYKLSTGVDPSHENAAGRRCLVCLYFFY